MQGRERTQWELGFGKERDLGIANRNAPGQSVGEADAGVKN